MRRPFKLIVTSLLSWFWICSYSYCYSQSSNCDILATLQSKNLQQARSFIFKTLKVNPAQSSCFFKRALEVHDSAAIKHLPLAEDTIFKILNIWYTVGNDCEVFNEEAKRIYIYKNGLKSYKEDFCPLLTFSSLHCKNYNYYPETILALGMCLGNKYDANNERYSCESEEFIWKYIAAHPELVSQPEWKRLKYKSQYALLACPFLSCNKLDSLFLREIEDLDINELKKINSLLSQKQCTSNKLYSLTSIKILDKEPSFNGLYQFANTNKNSGNVAESYNYYSKAEKLANKKEQKALCYLGIAELLELQKNYEKAKEFAQIAAYNDPNNRESFVLLATLYQKAESLCSLKDQVDLAALNLLISKTYKQALMNDIAEKYYKLSNIELLLQQNRIKLNQKHKLNCFIKEEVEFIK